MMMPNLQKTPAEAHYIFFFLNQYAIVGKKSKPLPVFVFFLAACTYTLIRLLHHSGLLVREPHPPRHPEAGA